MSIHIGGKRGDIAETVLLPGDPLRAKFIADNFLENVVCYTEVRGMLGFTGTYKGKKISVQGTGMGLPSISIYVNELINDFGCQNLIRIGSCGGLQEDVKVRDIVLAQGACTDSSMNKLAFKGMDYAPIANFELLKSAYDIGMKLKAPIKVGNIFSADTFYNDDEEEWKIWARAGVLAVEMEAAALYRLAAKFRKKALGIMTVSDHLVTKEALSAQERQTTFKQMMEIGLEVAINA
jgi:purine-nucleoside phosphorylase